MKKLEAIIRRSKTDDVLHALAAHGFHAVTLLDMRGVGNERPKNETYRGIEYSDPYVPRVKVEIVVDDDGLDDAVEAILLAAFTGKVGDGKIFISDLEAVIHIRTGESHGNHLLENCG